MNQPEDARVRYSMNPEAGRGVPIFPELRPHLDELFAAATKGFEQTVNPDDWVLPSFRREAANNGDWCGVNLRTQFEKILKRAGVTPWPRLWPNLRASRQTELEGQFPSHVVCAWLGNSEAVARKHYLQVREVDFAKAVRNPMQLASAQPRTAPHDCTANAKTLGVPRVLAKNVGDTGFDSHSTSAGNVQSEWQSGAHSGARHDAGVILADDDAGLAAIVEAWPMLSADARREMLEFVDRELGAVAAADRAR